MEFVKKISQYFGKICYKYLTPFGDRYCVGDAYFVTVGSGCLMSV